MTQPTVAGKQGAHADLVSASEHWVSAFSAAPLDPADAADLVSGALKVTHGAAQATRQLSWESPDAFIAVMRQAEQSNGG